MDIIEKKNCIQEEVYSALKRAILTLHYEPGMAMSTQEIATRLNVSRTPVREAFVRLHSEGLVETLPQRGTFVSRIDLHLVEQERFIRESLEIAIVDSFLARCSPEIIEKLKMIQAQHEAAICEKSSADIMDIDSEWHKVIFDVAGFPLAWNTMMTAHGNYNRIRVLSMELDEIRLNVASEHHEILDALESRDAEKSRETIKKHVSKLKVEKYDMVRQYPDYFKGEENIKCIRLDRL